MKRSNSVNNAKSPLSETKVYSDLYIAVIFGIFCLQVWHAISSALRVRVVGFGEPSPLSVRPESGGGFQFSSAPLPPDLKYTILNNDPYESHRLALDLTDGASRILEVGAATGYITEALIAKGADVVAIEIDPQAAAAATARGINVRVGTIDTAVERHDMFDCVLLLDVIEHVTEADDLIAKCLDHLERNGTLVISVPNIAHWSVRWALARGRFNYTRDGLLDNTHVHFYTASTLERLLTRHGLSVIERRYSIGIHSYKTWPSRELQWQRRKILHAAAARWPELFAYQFVWKAVRRR